MKVTTILLGGTCNNLFQIAAVLSYSLKHKCDYCIPTTIQNPHSEGQKVFYSPHLKYCDIESGERTIYIEPHFHYREIPKFDVDVLVLSGYFQSWKYFDDYKNEILKLLSLDEIKTKEGVCSIHYRATDYKYLPTIHPIISEDYIIYSIIEVIQRCLEPVPQGCRKFIVFSDDIPAIKKIITDALEQGKFGILTLGSQWFKECEFEYSEGRTEIEDLKLMASCANNIIANSSFSWWASYINPNPKKIVIAPKNSRWFGKDMQHDTKDLYTPQMILM